MYPYAQRETKGFYVMSDGLEYDEFYRRANGSEAFSRYCEETFGVDLTQVEQCPVATGIEALKQLLRQRLRACVVGGVLRQQVLQQGQRLPVQQHAAQIKNDRLLWAHAAIVAPCPSAEGANDPASGRPKPDQPPRGPATRAAAERGGHFFRTSDARPAGAA